MANKTGKFGLGSLIAVIITDIVLCGISLGCKAFLVGTGANAQQISHSWVVVPIVLVAFAVVIQLARMMKANRWGCLPTTFFMFSAVMIWLIPIGR